MQKLKKLIKLPPKNTMIIYSILIALIIAVFIIAYMTVGKSLTSFVSDTQGFKLWLDSYKNLSGFIFVLIRAFQTVVKIIPAEPLEIASGYAFGTFGGLALCSLGTFLGSLVIVLFSRVIGSKFIFSFINEEEFNKLKLISNSKNQNLFLIIFYLIPGTPKDIFTYIFSATGCNMTKFFIITTICRIPSIITSTIVGSQLEQNNIILAVVIFVLTGAVSLVSTVIYKKYENKKSGITA